MNFPAPRIPSLRSQPIAFAHRGARAHAPENTLEAFELALRLGATGLESDAWLTADGQVVLDHDGLVRRGLRNRKISELDRADLPPHIPTITELYERCGDDFELSIDVKDPAAAEPLVEQVSACSASAVSRLWLCHYDWHLVATWRTLHDEVRLVDSTRLRAMDAGPERRAADLAAAGIDAVNMHFNDWTGGISTLFHRFEIFTFGWDAQHDRMIDELLRMGIDGIYSDHVDRLADRFRENGVAGFP